jgi:predicted nuclease with TOPRIM domain
MFNKHIKEKQEELNRQRRLIKELEEELQIRNDEHKKEREKNLEIIASVEKFEKSLIKEINEEQRKLASICFIPKFIKYSNNPKSNSLVSLDTLQSIFVSILID